MFVAVGLGGQKLYLTTRTQEGWDMYRTCLKQWWHNYNCSVSETGKSWSCLVEGDEQLDWPNSQTSMELCHAYVA